MAEKGKKHGVPAWMVMEGKPEVKIMRRNHEVRTEECVCFTMDKFRKLGALDV